MRSTTHRNPILQRKGVLSVELNALAIPMSVSEAGSAPKEGKMLLSILSAATRSESAALPVQLLDSHRPRNPGNIQVGRQGSRTLQTVNSESVVERDNDDLPVGSENRRIVGIACAPAVVAAVDYDEHRQLPIRVVFVSLWNCNGANFISMRVSAK